MDTSTVTARFVKAAGNNTWLGPSTLAGLFMCCCLFQSMKVLAGNPPLLDQEWTKPFVGDLPEMKTRHVIRVLVTHNKTNFFVVKGQPHGFEYELLQEYAKWLNKTVKKRQIKTRLVFIPVPFDKLLTGLRNGKGDLAASGLTITPERRKLVNFTIPYVPNVEEIIVARKGLKGVKQLRDLQNRSVFFVQATSYEAHLRELNHRFKRQGWKAIIPKAVGEYLATEDLLEMTNSGAIDLTVADKHMATLWSGVLPNIRIRPDLKIHTGGQIAWALRHNSPKLKKSLDAFLTKHKKGTLVGNILFHRYYKNDEWITNPLARQEQQKLARYITLLKKYGKEYRIDWMLLAAQAYQESGFNHKKKSPRGAVGLMQILPATANNPPINIRNIHLPEKNIQAAAKYLAYIRDRYFADRRYSPNETLNFALAAYNAGPAKIRFLQDKAKALGFDPYVWFSNMEQVVLRFVGREPVRYVANIHKYYLAYRLIDMSNQKKDEELKDLKAG